MKFAKNSVVRLKTFKRKLSPNGSVDKLDNYWLLIGSKGVIIDFDGDSEKALILFDDIPDNLGLANHNPIKNSLWINISDLEML